MQLTGGAEYSLMQIHIFTPLCTCGAETWALREREMSGLIVAGKEPDILYR
jgi:hypothetical protein